MIELASADAICTGRQLGEVIGVTGQQVERLARDGVLKTVRCKARGRRYRLGESVQAYFRYSRESVKRQCSREGAGYDDARAQRMKALAEIEALRLKQLRGELMRCKGVTATVVMLLRNTFEGAVLAANSCAVR